MANVFQIVNNRDNNRTQKFLYDPLNRISQAYSSGPNWGETYGPTATNPGVPPTSSGIDAWGNLTNRSGVTGKSNTEGWSCLATNQNQIGSCSISYDPAGNTTQNGNVGYTYDAENRLIATQGTPGVSYLYDGDGKRVEKCTQGTTPGTCATGATGTLYWTGPGSDPLAETDLAGNVLENYIFFNGQRIARREPGTPATIHFYFSDHLGSHGVVTNNTGSTCEQDIDYYPFGGVEQDYCPTVSQHFKFTGKERDAESGMDYFGARYNASNMGRFMTPDSIAYSGLDDPQSLNLYSYVGNHPTNMIDPDGRCWSWAQRICDLAKNAEQRVDNLFHGEGFHTNNGVEDKAHRNNESNRQEELKRSTAYRMGVRYGNFLNQYNHWWAAHDREGSPGGCGLGPSLASLGVYRRPTRTLFRAVDRTEFEDIQNTGKFGRSPGGAESKYFLIQH